MRTYAMAVVRMVARARSPKARCVTVPPCEYRAMDRPIAPVMIAETT
jgi:hypothetical protein